MLLQGRLQLNVDTRERLRYRAVRFGVLGKLLERGGVDAGDLGRGLQFDLVDGPAGARLIEMHGGGSVNGLGRMARAAQGRCQRHGETTRVGRSQQLFRVGLAAPLESRPEAVIAIQGAGLYLQVSAAFFERTV